MKKLVYAAFALMLALLCAFGSFAGRYDEVFVSSLQFDIIGDYGTDVLGTHQMRAFCVDPNGKYYFGGNLQGGPTMYKFDAATGEELDYYQFDVDPGSYVKALAADDRGYVYNGIANAPNDGACFFSILNAETFEELSYVEILIDGKIGVNGITVTNIGGKYILYYMTNYDTDRLYKYDVTDPKAPALDTSFGSGGYLDITALGFGDGNGVAADPDGNIYLAGLKGGDGKGDTLVKLAADGSLVKELAVTGIWGVSYYDGYVITATRDGTDSKVTIFDAATLNLVADYAPYADAAGFSGAGIANDKIYVCDHSENDCVLVSAALNIPAPVVEAPVEVPTEVPVETPAEPAPVEAAPVTVTAAQTSDPIAISAAASLIALAAAFIGRRKAK